MVKPGYKQTEVGVIPEDWDVVSLGDIGQCFIGLTYKPEDIDERGTLVLRSSNIRGGRLDYEDSVYVNMELPDRVITRPNDILVCVRNGSKDLIGKTALIDEKGAGSAFGAFMSIYRSDLSGYIFHQFQSDNIKRQINANLGATINQITSKDLNSFRVAIPRNKDEANLIAGVLGDVDALLAALERLIAKKRDVKTAVMQQLLTGEKRLPGFTGRWTICQLGSVCEIVSGGTPSTANPQFWGGDILWCTPTDITATHGKYLTSTARKITEAGLNSSSANLLPKGALLLCTRATVGEVKIATSPVTTNQGFKSLVCNPGTDNEFMYYLLLTAKPKLIEKGVGSTFLEVSKKDIASLEIHLPDLDEQVAISKVLSDLDAEITALEARHTKTQAIKQGMMQELLTGRTRLL